MILDRRAFLAGASSTIVACTCSFARAQGAAATQGCRTAAAGDILLKDRIRYSSGNDPVDRFCRHWHSALLNEFALRPGFGFFDDGDQPNALATPAVLIPEGVDGTVLLGIALLNHELGSPLALPESGELVTTPSTRPSVVGYAKLAIILAHEFGHILQYKNGMMPDGPWQMEPFADFLAGWALGRRWSQLSKMLPGDHGAFTYAVLAVLAEENAVQTIFAKGDTLFYDRDHHGEPEFRAAMVRAGYDAIGLDVKRAFEKGKTMSGVPPSNPPR